MSARSRFEAALEEKNHGAAFAIAVQSGADSTSIAVDEEIERSQRARAVAMAAVRWLASGPGAQTYDVLEQACAEWEQVLIDSGQA